MGKAAGAVQGGGDAGDDGRRGQSLQSHGRMEGRAEAAFLDEGLAVHPGGGEGAAGLTQDSAGIWGRARFRRRPPLHKCTLLTHIGVAVIGRLARGLVWLTSRTLPAWAILS